MFLLQVVTGTLAVSVVTLGAVESVDVNAAAVGYRYCCVQVLGGVPSPSGQWLLSGIGAVECYDVKRSIF